MGISCERNSSYSFVLIVLKLCMCFPHGMRMCMWIGHSCWINFCHFFGIVNLVIFHPEYIDSGYLLWAQLLLQFLYQWCMWIAHNCWISFCHFLDIVNLVIFHPEYIDSGCLLWVFVGMGVEWGAGATPLSAEFWFSISMQDPSDTQA